MLSPRSQEILSLKGVITAAGFTLCEISTHAQNYSLMRTRRGNGPTLSYQSASSSLPCGQGESRVGEPGKTVARRLRIGINDWMTWPSPGSYRDQILAGFPARTASRCTQAEIRAAAVSHVPVVSASDRISADRVHTRGRCSPRTVCVRGQCQAFLRTPIWPSAGHIPGDRSSSPRRPAVARAWYQCCQDLYFRQRVLPPLVNSTYYAS